MNYLLSELLNDLALSSKQNVGNLFNSIQDRWGRQKDPSTSFFTVNFANVGINLQNSLTFSFNPFPTPV